jgi:hypothetical protein
MIAEMPCPIRWGERPYSFGTLYEASSDQFLIELPDGEKVARLIASESWQVQIADVWVTDQAVRWSNGFLG